MFRAGRHLLVVGSLGTSVLASGCVVGSVEPDFTFAELRIKATNSEVCWRVAIDGSSRLGCGNKTYTFDSDSGHFDATVVKRSGAGQLTAAIWVDDEFVDSATIAPGELDSVTISSKP